jgi:GGDEF domain-containing protein
MAREEIPIPADRVQAAEKSFARSVFWSRLMLSAFFTVTAVTLVWAIPWFPYGTSVEDYNSRVGMMVLLALSAAVFAFAALRLREKMKHVESTYVTMSTVHDRLADLRRREYFYDHLLLECDRAKQSGEIFAVFVLRNLTDQGDMPGVNAVECILEALEPLAKEYDWLAPVGYQEVAMFAPHLASDRAEAFAEDLRRRVDQKLEEVGVRVAAGWAVYGDGLAEAGDLLGQARRTVTRNLDEYAAA